MSGTVPMQRVLIVLAALVAAAWATVALLPADLEASTAQPVTMPASAQIESEYGVRFSLVGVTADGGLVDVRFVVLDEERAGEMLEDEAGLPLLVTERNGKVLPSAAMMPMEHDLTAGRTYSVLYRNTAGAIRAGDDVTVQFPDLELNHVVAG